MKRADRQRTGRSVWGARGWAACGALAWSLLGVPAQALVVTVDLGWGYNYGGAGTSVDLAAAYNLQVGSIVQVVMYNSTADYPENQPPGDTAGENFDAWSTYTGPGVPAEPYGSGHIPGTTDTYRPETTPEGHVIAYTSTIQAAPVTDAQGDTWYQVYAQFEVLGTYDRLYIRVFGATDFTGGEVYASYWGISDVKVGTNVIDTWYVPYIDNTTATNIAYFEVIPEPGTMALIGLGGVGLLAGRRRRRAKGLPEA